MSGDRELEEETRQVGFALEALGGDTEKLSGFSVIAGSYVALADDAEPLPVDLSRSVRTGIPVDMMSRK